MNARRLADFAKLQALIDGVAVAKDALQTDEFKSLLNTVGGGSDEEGKGEAEEADAAPPMLPLPLPAPAQADLEFARKVALGALQGLGTSVDISRRRSAEVAGVRYKCMFDNCTHQSGRPRVYGTCLEKTRHCACFEYKCLRFGGMIRKVQRVASFGPLYLLPSF